MVAKHSSSMKLLGYNFPAFILIFDHFGEIRAHYKGLVDKDLSDCLILILNVIN